MKLHSSSQLLAAPHWPPQMGWSPHWTRKIIDRTLSLWTKLKLILRLTHQPAKTNYFNNLTTASKAAQIQLVRNQTNIFIYHSIKFTFFQKKNKCNSLLTFILKNLVKVITSFQLHLTITELHKFPNNQVPKTIPLNSFNKTSIANSDAGFINMFM